MIIFVPFLRVNFGQTYKQKLCIFALFGHILGEIQVVPKEHLVEFVTLDIFKLYMSIKADRLVYKNVPNCFKFIFKCFITQIVPNGMKRVE